MCQITLPRHHKEICVYVESVKPTLSIVWACGLMMVFNTWCVSNLQMNASLSYQPCSSCYRALVPCAGVLHPLVQVQRLSRIRWCPPFNLAWLVLRWVSVTSREAINLYESDTIRLLRPINLWMPRMALVWRSQTRKLLLFFAKWHNSSLYSIAPR